MSTHNLASGAALASVSTATLTAWVVLAVAVGIALGLLGARLTGRRHSARPAPTAALPPDAPVPPAGGALRGTVPFVDDLPGFLEHPPGTPAPSTSRAPSAPRTGATASTVSAPSTGDAGGGPSARSAVLAMVVAAVVLVVLAVVVAVTAGRGPADTTSTAPTSAAATSAVAGAATAGTTAPATAPTGSAAAGVDPAVPTTVAPETTTETAAAALAFSSVPLGDDGVAASVTFGGVLLEQRAVGLTVTYPSLSVSSDGAQALAHVRLPTFNCLTDEPPADPMAAGCSRSLTEYADLASPALQVSRDGERLDVLGLFPTYTRFKGSSPAYTGRAYQLTATISPAGAVRGGVAAASGVVRIGLDSAPSTPVPGVNVLQYAG
ncbi:hypothetical protein [Modestobacter sp. DSM 44400]|uniref:hypothetical protein n=1 Tax=Modestobacter sp. DSM 44400 TaxID=1550230 RepID=UPI0011151B2E|nr:hypothetical protein [Modestobacter sp. DSM 44400]